jgi:hypothetical protein
MKALVLKTLCLFFLVFGINIHSQAQSKLPSAKNIPNYQKSDKIIWPEALITVPEKTNYQSTSTHEDIMRFIEYLKSNSSKVHVEIIGNSNQGKAIPLVVLSETGIKSPEEAKAKGLPSFYVQANIHGGEVEGKEAVLILMREILFGNRGHLLDNQVILIAPVYNIDGNDNLGENTRPSQEGSPRTAGTRANGAGLDLNRDGMKVEANETKALMANVINRWDPQLLVDLHTTNGTWHGYPLTWAPSYHSAGEYGPYNFTWNTMLPQITETIYQKYDLLFGPFGDFYGLREWPVTSFFTYNHHPRYLVNQMGFRNRLGILSEGFAHERFYQRIYSSHAFITEILEFTNNHAMEIVQINNKAEKSAIDKVLNEAGKAKKGVRYKMVAMDEPLNLRTYNYLTYVKENGDTAILRTPEIVNIEGVEYFAKFEPTLESTLPRGYVFGPEYAKITEILRTHGVKVDILNQNKSFEGEEFIIASFSKAPRAFEGHNMVNLDGSFVKTKKTFRKGSFVVDAAQPLANLIFYLLEPQSDDGLTTWNFFDEWIEKPLSEGKKTSHPIFKYYN